MASDASGTCVVTPNARLAASLAREFNHARIAEGLNAWEAADILPFGAWVERLYGDALYSVLGERLPVLLSAAQEHALWERVIARDSGSPLLSVPRAAALARDAWVLMHEWRLAESLGSLPAGDDARAFRAWSTSYERLTAREGSVERARLPVLLEPLLAHAAIRRCSTLVVHGFDLIKPQQQALFDAMAALGTEVLVSGPTARQGSACRVALTSTKDEIEAAAQWARTRLEAAGNAFELRIGIVVPDLRNQRNAVLRGLERTFGTRTAFNVSLGEPLSSYPIVAAGLMLLELATGEVPFTTISRLIRSPFIGGSESELVARATLDAELRRSAAPSVGLEALRRLITRSRQPGRSQPTAACPRLDQRLSALATLSKQFVGQRDAAQWARLAGDWLLAAGHPGERTLDSFEYQALKKWHEVIASLASLERVTGSMTFAEARSRLASLAADTLFQPEASDVPVQVLGVLESAGLEFDHLWVMGLTDEAWPLAARPNPFVPVALQREAGVPEASATASLELDRRITEGWRSAAGEVVFSHALREEDRELVCSPLIRDTVEAPIEALQLTSFRTLAAALHEARREERITDSAPVLASRVSGGGTSLFTDQAACPFRAFARHRLGTRELELPAVGIDARERGTLVHELLARLWTRLKTQAVLEAASTADLDALVTDAVETAMARVRRYRPDALKGRLAVVEKERLANLAHAWLKLELARPPFEVVAIEQKQAVSFGGVSVNARLDRMDRIASPEGPRHVVIDYKTGQVNVAEWLGERPGDPQLPLYAVGRGGPQAIDAAAFARVRAGDSRFVGMGREEGLIAGVRAIQSQSATRSLRDWDGALAAWRTALEALGREFVGGEASVNPKNGDETCRYCDLKALCRINERSSAVSFDDAATPEAP